MDEQQHASTERRPADDRTIQSFLESFAKMLTRGETETLAECWATPAFVLGDEMSKVVSTAEEVKGFFAGAKDEYNKRGIVDTWPDIENVDWLTEKLVSVTVRWPYVDEDEVEIGEERSTYVLCRDELGDWKFRVAIMQGVTAPH